MGAVREILKFYVPLIVISIPGMFLLHAEDLTNGNALAVVGLYALYFLVILANFVFIHVVYLAESREIARATVFLSLLVNFLPISYMLISQTADLFVVSGVLILLLYSLFAFLDRVL